MQRSRDHSEWPCDPGGGVTLLFGEKGGWQSLLVSFLVNPWLGGKESELSTEMYKIPFLVSSTEVIIG